MYQLDVLLQDLRYGLRLLRRSPQLTCAIVLTLILGVGLNSVVLSIFNGLLFRAQVSRDPTSFVQMYAKLSGRWHREIHGNRYMLTLEDFEAIRARTTTLSAVTASKWASVTLRDAEPVDIRGKFVSCNYMSAHMRPALLGRGFVEADCSAPGGQPVVVLTELGWNVRFWRDPAIIGRTLRLQTEFVTVIGVVPDNAVGEPIAPLIYVPYTMQPLLEGPADYFREPPERHAWLNLSGRLAPGQTASAAQDEVNAIVKSLDRLHPGRITEISVTNGALILEPGSARNMPILIGLIMGGTTLILVLVCANVTVLLLARATARRHEIAVRLSIGASRTRLVRQLLTESLALALAAAAISLGLAYFLPGPIAQMLTEFPVRASFEPDWRVFVYTLAIAIVAAGAAALSPAAESLRFGLAGAFKPLGHTRSAQTSSHVRGMLIADQVAISLALLVAIGLVVRAQDRMLKPNLPYDPNAVLVTNIDLGRARYSVPAARAFYGRLLPRLEAMPGVQAVALSTLPPFRGQSRISFTLDGSGDDNVSASSRGVSPSYFRVMGVPLVQGQLFSEADAQTPGRLTPVVVSESLARTLSAGVNSIGRRLSLSNGVSSEIVGVVADSSTVRPAETDDRMIYHPITAATVTTASVLIQFAGDARPLIQAVRTEVHATDVELIPTVETVATTLAQEADHYAAVVRLTAIPAGLALFLSIVGIYGVTAFAAAQRTQEIGIRSAIGARPHQIVGLLLRSLMWPLLAGLAVGVPLAALGARVLQRANLLGEFKIVDSWAFGGALLVLVCAASAATLIPALNVARLDPGHALRNE